MSTPAQEPLPEPSGLIHPPEAPVRTITLVRWGILGWAAVLVVLLAVPALRAEEHGWWVWVPVAGIALGAVGHAYLRRGRGNAEFA